MAAMRKYLAEMLGTFVLTFMGCGAAVALGCNDTDMASVVGTAMSFGLAVTAMAYTIGGISGCHINPAVSLGFFLCGRISAKDLGFYVLFQIAGAILAAAVLRGTLISIEPANAIVGTGANICKFGVNNGLIVEIVLTFIFVVVVLGATSKSNKSTASMAGLAIGLSLMLIHLVGIRFTGTSVNPARSIGPALFEGSKALHELWVFIVGPLIGGAIAAAIWKGIGSKV